MKVLAITSIRSEYDLMTPLFSKLEDDEDIQLKLLVSGAHNSVSFGYTCNDIKKDGFDILLEIESLIDADSKSARLKSAAILLISAVDIVKSYNPDLIIYAGDREDVMIGALLGGYLGTPTIHFYGGDHAADGHIDNPIRHAVSKLSTCHFVSTDEHKKRLLNLKEPEWRIFNVGSIALDKFRLIPKNKDIARNVAHKHISKPIALVIYHPIHEEIAKAPSIVRVILSSLVKFGYHCFVGLPNTDPGNIQIRNTINKFSAESDDVTVYGNLCREDFVSLFKSSSIIVGNSSAGLLEAASIPIPCINVGMRQRGRSCGKNVIFVDAQQNDIESALVAVSSDRFQSQMKTVVNPYGDGYSAEKAFSLIKSIDFKSLLDKKEDPLCE
ncbi:UDP-N-acetylglucosamine 2-epimerase [Shewanella litorisediminis]|uniref:UDP-N-acetylglucosamine 2-epimerase (Hydrolyzing) n=1 Tax=Shewanella litorisediminis TaxID=1173586 RepID=A0ABX7G000_9GAMM|nr:UDP-N-acetylglucosamine 2-epimerase [Shewanella litorisediminis]MCL2918345.1 UDP-N-acetylglucosamine 2-epimerase [Shewanella litorisediminis]QRH00608.1 UDP-N-acetylglucosamine 2-epimerase (hydrolyzing) [Shewanella litorisediminis]